jgi:hypothetical protein
MVLDGMVEGAPLLKTVYLKSEKMHYAICQYLSIHVAKIRRAYVFKRKIVLTNAFKKVLLEGCNIINLHMLTHWLRSKYGTVVPNTATAEVYASDPGPDLDT